MAPPGLAAETRMGGATAPRTDDKGRVFSPAPAHSNAVTTPLPAPILMEAGTRSISEPAAVREGNQRRGA